VDVIDDDKGLLPVCVLRDCHVVVCVSQSSLSLPLSDRVPVVAVAVIQLLLPLSDRVSVLVALGGKNVMVTRMMIEGVSTLLLMIQDCCWFAFFAIAML